MQRHFRRALSIMVLLLAAGFALLPYLRMSLPVMQPAEDSPAAGRAMQIITAISQSPRGVGTANHAATRELLRDELRAMGMEVQTQEVAVENAPVPLLNIAGRLAGTNPEHPAVLLVAHYDADPLDCPGAADNASGVAVILEIARGVAEGPQPANDLIVLFTDGEELGVLGAPHFLRHAWAKSVKVALNFDSLSIGPAFLWQTSPQNGWLIAQYARTPLPMAGSWIDSIGRALPLDTDFRPLMEAGITGGSFTSPYLPPTSHTALDQPHLVNAQTIQHGLQQGLALTRGLLSSDLTETTAPDRVYFNLWAGWFVSFPAGLASGLGLLTGLGAFGAAAWYVRRGVVPVRAVASGALFGAANLFFALFVQAAVEIAIFLTRPLLSPWARIPFSLVLLGLLLVIGYRRLGRRIAPQALLLGGQLVWAVLVVWSSLANPLFSPLLTLILLTSLLPYILPVLRLPRASVRPAWFSALAVILLLGAPVVFLLYMITGLLLIPATFGAVAWALIFALIYPIQACIVEDAYAIPV